MLSMSLHFQIHSWTQSQSSQRGLGEKDPTASQSAHRELAPTYPHQVYRLVCSHLRNLASSVDQYISSRPASLIFHPTSECNLNKFFSSFENTSRICSRNRTPADIRKRDTEAYVLTPSIQAGGVWVLCGLHTEHARDIIIFVYRSKLRGTWDFYD